VKRKLYLFSNSLLFMGVSIYFGTGWSTAIFQFPVMPRLTVDNYYLHFIPQIDAATNFFTFLVTLLVITCLVMIVGEWKTGLRWLPITLLVAVIGATCLTMFVIFPVNDILRKGIHDPNQLRQIIDRWKLLTEVRVGIWSFEWSLMMFYFATKAYGKAGEQ
jgi:MFS superfamily sulfate permease-like transporter